MTSRVVTVEADRLERWVEGFAAHHGGLLRRTREATGLLLSAPDGASARVVVPFPSTELSDADPTADEVEAQQQVRRLVASVRAPRRVALVLVRRGGYGCAVVVDGGVAVSKVGTRYVQSRTAAGGWSQQRFARRRDNQAQTVVRDCADAAVRLLVPAPALDALVTGGDRPLVERVLADPRLSGLRALAAGPHLAVADPRADVVKAAAASLTAVRITLTEA